MNKPVVLFYCRHTEGMGALTRCLVLGQALSDTFHFVVLNGGPPPSKIVIPESISILQLPRLDGIDSSAVSLEGKETLEESRHLRRDMILEAYAQLNPRVLIIDLFPFGPRTLNDELMPLLEHARDRNSSDTLVLCSLRDTLVADRRDHFRQDDAAARVLEKYFDAVLVHSDPVFARLEESFQPKNALSTPVYFTGFVAAGDNAKSATKAREERVLVSAGSGQVGMPLFSAAVEAHRLLWGVERLPMTIIAGPLLPPTQWLTLQELGSGLPGLTIKRTVPSLRREVEKIRWSVCHCGYNAAVEALASKVAVLFVPYVTSGNTEQIDRAERLAYWGGSRLLMQHHLNGVSLANEIQQLVKFNARPVEFNFDGAKNTATLVQLMVQSSVEGAGVSLMPY